MSVTIYINYVIIVYFVVLFEPLRHVACIYSLQTTKPTLKKGANPSDPSHGVKAKTT